MKKYILPLILYTALLLPITTLGSEPTPNWYEKIYSYMPQDKKTYAGLIAALSLGYLVYTLQKGLDFTSIDQNDVYAPSNMRNIAIFLSHVESDIFWRLFRIIAFNARGDWNAANEELFKEYVYPILEKLPNLEPAIWTNLITTARQNLPEGSSLKRESLYYLETLKYYLIKCCDNQPLLYSLQIAINSLKNPNQ